MDPAGSSASETENSSCSIQVRGRAPLGNAKTRTGRMAWPEERGDHEITPCPRCGVKVWDQVAHDVFFHSTPNKFRSQRLNPGPGLQISLADPLQSTLGRARKWNETGNVHHIAVENPHPDPDTEGHCRGCRRWGVLDSEGWCTICRQVPKKKLCGSEPEHPTPGDSSISG
jgi:hypothetical protein